MRRCDRSNRLRPGLPHNHAKFPDVNVENCLDTRLTEGGQAPCLRSADADRCGTKRERLEHIGAIAEVPTIARLRHAYCLSKTMVSSVFSPFASVILKSDVNVLPSLETVRRVVPMALPALINVNSAELLSTCFPERPS